MLSGTLKQRLFAKYLTRITGLLLGQTDRSLYPHDFMVGARVGFFPFDYAQGQNDNT